jgi:hypothetical protein
LPGAAASGICDLSGKGEKGRAAVADAGPSDTLPVGVALEFVALSHVACSAVAMVDCRVGVVGSGRFDPAQADNSASNNVLAPWEVRLPLVWR